MKTLATLLLFLCSGYLFGQTTISGLVTDEQNKPVPGANIFIKDSYDGTTSDANGKFSFSTDESGEKTLVVTFIGFVQNEQKVMLDGKAVDVKIKMKEAVTELKAVTIAAGAFEASDEKKMVMLRPLDIVTTAGSNGDIYGAIQTLPGTAVVGDKEGLFVRGGDATESKTYIDGLLVDNPYFTSVPDVPQRGRFSPFLFKGTAFSSGGYSAQYGQAMSSVLILESQDLAEASGINIGVMSVGGSLGKTWRKEKYSLGIYGGYTDLSPYFQLFKTNRNWFDKPRAVNGSVIYRLKTSKTGIVKVFASWSWNKLGVAVPDTSDPLLERKFNFGLENDNFYSSASYKEIVFKSWTLNAATSFSTNRDHFSFDNYPVYHRNDLSESRISVSHGLGSLSVIRFGGEYQHFTDETPKMFSSFKEDYSAAFAEADVYITSKLVSRVGVRAENSQAIQKQNVAPRLSLAYKTGQFSQFSLAFGNFFQVPDKTYLNTYLSTKFDFEKATHYILNFQHVSDSRTFRIETYYKDYSHLFYLPVLEGRVIPGNTGSGYAQGVEFFYRDKKTVSKGDFWISYSYLDSKRQYRNYPAEATPTFAPKHTASLVFKYFFPKISLAPSLTYAYSTGRTYYNPNNPVFLGDKTPDYHNVSLNFSYLTSIGKSFTVLVLSVNNVFGFKNIYGYNYSSDGSHRYTVDAASTRFFFAGVFINIGSQKDDSDKYN
ncbi:MAG: TonB-dependent receptor [Bacteroidia bacterium]